jgi:hypothetical protein
MTDPQTAETPEAVLDHYCEAFRAILGHLAALLDCAQCQESAAHVADFDALERATLRRRDIMQAVASADATLQVTRAQFASDDSALPLHPRFASVRQLHGHARSLVAEIAERDARVQDAVARARDRAGADAHQLEMGETGLAAYRRVVAPPPDSAELVDRRG